MDEKVPYSIVNEEMFLFIDCASGTLGKIRVIPKSRVKSRIVPKYPTLNSKGSGLYFTSLDSTLQSQSMKCPTIFQQETSFMYKVRYLQRKIS